MNKQEKVPIKKNCIIFKTIRNSINKINLNLILLFIIKIFKKF